MGLSVVESMVPVRDGRRRPLDLRTRDRPAHRPVRSHQRQYQLVRGADTRLEDDHTRHATALREAFQLALARAFSCTNVAWHYIGGEELSRAHIGDPGSLPPLVPVPRSESKRAFAFLDEHLFSPSAWNLSPSLLRQLVYTEWVTDLPTPAWAYNPPMRHDEPIAQIVESLQERTLSSIF